jgi:hypothetical protein
MKADELRAAIAAKQAERSKLVPHPIPEWGVTVQLHPLTLRESLRVDEDGTALDLAGRCALLAARAVRDADGNRVWSDDEAAGLSELPGAADILANIASRVRDLNKLGLTAADLADAKNG